MSAPASPTGSTQPKTTSSTSARVEVVAVADRAQRRGAELDRRDLVQRAVGLALAARRADMVVDVGVSHWGPPGFLMGQSATGSGSSGWAGYDCPLPTAYCRFQNCSALSAMVESAPDGDPRQMRRGLGQAALHEEAGRGELGVHALGRAIGAGLELVLRDPGHLRPHVAERDQAEQVHVVGGAGAGIVGLGHGVVHEPHRRLLEMAERGLQRRQQRLEGLVGAILLDESADLVEEGHDRPAAVAAELAADEIHRLNAVGALVDHALIWLSM